MPMDHQVDRSERNFVHSERTTRLRRTGLATGVIIGTGVLTGTWVLIGLPPALC
jgi:hypothetical protein